MSTLAEQVVEQLKTDMDNVYDAGYQKGKSEGGEYNLFKNTTTLKDVFKDSLFEDGAEIEVDCRNDSGNKIFSFENAFYRAKGVKKIKLSAVPTEKAGNLQGYSMYSSFSNCDAEIIDLSGVEPLKPYDIRYIFYNCKNLREVIGEFDLSVLSGIDYALYAFLVTPQLEEIRFKKDTINVNIQLDQSPLLSDTTIQSVIDGLSDLTGQTTQTITFHADVKAKLTEEQIATITSKNWTLA